MVETARDAYLNRNYLLAAEMYGRCLKERGPSPELYFGYADSLAKCGQIREALDVYSHCSRLMGSVPPEKLRHLAGALLEASSTHGAVQGRRKDTGLACVRCEGVLHVPVTLNCGHTFCRRCFERDKMNVCNACGQRLPQAAGQLDTNIMVRGLAEKWWAVDLEATRIRDEGNELFQRNDVEGALAKYDRALEYAPTNHLILSARSRALLRLNRFQAAFSDADAVTRLRPWWSKGHYRRGIALCSLGRYEEALISLCVSVSLDGNPNDVIHQVSHALHRLLTSPSARSRCHSPGLITGPYALNATHRHKANRYLAVSAHQKVYSDNESEENDSCDDDAHQGPSQCWPSTCSNTALQENSKLHNLLDLIINEIRRITTDTKSNIELPAINPQLIDRNDFDCILCCRTLWRPVTTPCGHTYCWSCLDRCLDYSCACPLCMTSLEKYLATSQRSITEFIERALSVLLPGAYAERQATHYQDLLLSGPHIPIFVCTTAFPGVPCPLFVYEPRYRNMVRRCMQAGSRQFGMVACLNNEPGAKRYAEYGTMQEIKDCVLMADGCSIVTTIGRRRFRVIAREERDGYDTAQVEILKDQPIQPEQLQVVSTLHNRVREKSNQWFNSTNPSIQTEIARTFGHMPALEDDWATITDGPAWTWWLLAILPLGPRLQVGILATTNLEKRLRAIDKTLDYIQQARPSTSLDTGDSSTSEQLVTNQSGNAYDTNNTQMNDVNRVTIG